MSEQTKKAIGEFDYLMRNSVEVLKGPDDPCIDEITAYMREYVRRCEKAKRGHVSDEEIWLASKDAPAPSRRTYRRF